MKFSKYCYFENSTVHYYFLYFFMIVSVCMFEVRNKHFKMISNLRAFSLITKQVDSRHDLFIISRSQIAILSTIIAMTFSPNCAALHTISAHIKCQDVQNSISLYIKCQGIQHTTRSRSFLPYAIISIRTLFFFKSLL